MQNLCNNEPMLSITMPVYNMEKYLSRSIESVLKQKYQNFELIIVDDGSTDTSSTILRKYAEMDKRITIISQKNQGLVLARENAIKKARGKYITFLDPDDWVEKEYYSKNIEFMEQNRLDIGIAGFSFAYENGDFKASFVNKDIEIYDREQALINLFAFKKYRWELCDKIYLTNVIKEIKIDSKVTSGEDLYRNWFAFNKAKKVGVLPIYGYYYFQHNNSMTKCGGKKLQNTVTYVFKKLDTEIEKSNKNVKKYFRYREMIFLILDAFELSKNNKEELMEIRKEIKNSIWDILVSSISLKRKIQALYIILLFF